MKGNYRARGSNCASRLFWRDPQKRRRTMILAFAAFFAVKSFFGETQFALPLFSDSYLRQSMDYVGVSADKTELCDFYMAESAIPRGGLGVFTAKPLSKGSPAQGWPDICIYLTHANSKRGTEIDTHTWQSYRFGAQWLGGRRDPRAACMGLVTIFNSMAMKEFASARPSADPNNIHKNGGLDRSRDPAAGAITEYYGATSVTIKDLVAGSELMLWDDGHGGDQYELDKLKEDGRNELDIDLVPQPMRPPEWLQKHGMCADNLKVQTATDPSMGRGAFARRFMSKGSVIAPAPLQIYPNRAKFSAPLQGHDRRKYESKSAMMFETEQLLVNYAFQPKGSTLLLYPYGPGVGSINHAGKKSGKINAKVRWSNHHTNHGIRWLDSSLTLDQFWKMQYPGSLILDVVALRDIRKGEEIFIDYGTEWEAAWKKYVREWKPFVPTLKNPNKEYKYAYPWDEMNKHGNRIKPYRTLSEQEANPYASNLMMVCDTNNWMTGRDERTKWQPSRNWPENLAVCNILSCTYNDKAKTYLYEVNLWPNDQHIGNEGTPIFFVVYDVPHTAIRFVDKPFHSDQHIPTAFRHPIGFPEELTPAFWKNELQTTQSEKNID